MLVGSFLAQSLWSERSANMFNVWEGDRRSIQRTGCGNGVHINLSNIGIIRFVQLQYTCALYIQLALCIAPTRTALLAGRALIMRIRFPPLRNFIRLVAGRLPGGCMPDPSGDDTPLPPPTVRPRLQSSFRIHRGSAKAQQPSFSRRSRALSQFFGLDGHISRKGRDSKFPLWVAVCSRQ